MALRSVALMALVASVTCKEGFVFLGATGDNALRPNGVWQGLYESFAGGVFDASTIGIHVAMNAPHSVNELHSKVLATLSPLYAELKNNSGWTCKATAHDCSPEALLKDVQTNIWVGRDADAQAKNMTSSLSGYERVIVYLSIPPFAFAGWSKAASDNWGGGPKHRVHVAAEKPFGTSLTDADALHAGIIATVPEANVHLVDHWLSFFMNRHLPTFRGIVQPRLKGKGVHGQLEWGGKDFSKIVVTEYETRGLAGRGGFFDKVGQVRDMVQSHLLQVLALVLIDPAAPSRSTAKLDLFNSMTVEKCTQGQYDGFLLEPKLSYHNVSADSTLTTMTFDVDLDAWKDVEVVISTGKDMGTTLYTVELFERDGPGVLTYEIGKEETGVAGIKVRGWPLRDSSAFDAPYPGFTDTKTFHVQPAVSAGDGYILQYSDPGMYFPKPYAMMLSALLKNDYSQAFVTYPECRRSWEVVTGSSAAACLDPPPETVDVYKPPATCGHAPPAVCYEGFTVQHLYAVTFACTTAHDAMYKNVSLYQAKCHSPLVKA